MASQPKTIDDYLAAVRPEQRKALQALRRTIRSAAPRAEECISYGLAAFRQGRMLVAFGAKPGHCAFYVMSATALDGFEAELEGFETSKGTVRFQPERPLPAALVRKLVKARLAENAALDGAAQGRASKSPSKGARPRTGRAARRASEPRKAARRTT